MTPAERCKSRAAHARGARGALRERFFQSTQIINLTSRPHFIVRSRRPRDQGIFIRLQIVTVHVDTSSYTAESGGQYKAPQRSILSMW